MRHLHAPPSPRRDSCRVIWVSRATCLAWAFISAMSPLLLALLIILLLGARKSAAAEVIAGSGDRILHVDVQRRADTILIGGPPVRCRRCLDSRLYRRHLCGITNGCCCYNC